MRVKVTYLCHSGFLLEWDACYWLFDYYRGELPDFSPDKKLLVFCSHSHRDHFNPEILELAGRHPHTEYIFSSELKRALGRERKKCPERSLPQARLFPAQADETLLDGAGGEIRLHTLPSTDCGAAFLLEYQGRSVYHAGDLHWWIWPGEPEEDNRRMTERYEKIMALLRGRTIDLAFTPLDPRQEEYYDRGLTYLLETARIGYAFPMHFWGEFSVIPRYLESRGQMDTQVKIIKIEEDGQSWEVCL